jgi:hypothetical protein
VAADLVHEALGHGIASWLTGDRILSLSTVAIQNATANRWVSAAGTSANCIAGVLCFLVLRRMRQLTPVAYFLWSFGAYNLLNSGYLVTSAVLNSGDWANVIAGLSPAWLWRCVLGLAGITLYVSAIRWAAGPYDRPGRSVLSGSPWGLSSLHSSSVHSALASIFPTESGTRHTMASFGMIPVKEGLLTNLGVGA